MVEKRKKTAIDIYFPTGSKFSKNYEKFIKDYRKGFQISGGSGIFTKRRSRKKKDLFDL